MNEMNGRIEELLEMLERGELDIDLELDAEKVKCACCGKMVDADDCTIVDGDHVCNECITEEYHICEHCERIIHRYDAVWVDDYCYCEDCIEELFRECDDCGELYPRYDGYWTGDGRHICEACRYDHYYECVDCGELYHEDDCYYDDNTEENYCSSCWENRRNRAIHDYYYKPAPIFHGGRLDRMYLGVELEIDDGGEYDDNAKVLLDLANGDLSEEHIYCKHDGSLNNGFEIVSHPATLAYHENSIPWRELMEKALSMRYRSHDTTTCGLHVHVSRSALGNTYDEREQTIAKILYFIESHWYKILRFSRRTESQVNRWARRYVMERNAVETYERAKRDFDRYHCLNLQNDNTIEFRMFRGTLKHSTFVATLQFVHDICKYCMGVSMFDIEFAQWNEFVESIPAEHIELREYLIARNI